MKKPPLSVISMRKVHPDSLKPIEWVAKSRESDEYASV